MIDFVKTFNFPFTGAQKTSVETMLNDFKIGHPMARLWGGDVGSGKTKMAATASYAVVFQLPHQTES